MGMDHVELVGTGVDLGQHLQMEMRCDVDHLLPAHLPPQRLGHDGNEMRRGVRRTRAEQRHVVAGGHHPVGERGNHPFGAAVQGRRHRLEQRRDLGDAHHAAPRSVGCGNGEGVSEPHDERAGARDAHIHIIGDNVGRIGDSNVVRVGCVCRVVGVVLEGNATLRAHERKDPCHLNLGRTSHSIVAHFTRRENRLVPRRPDCQPQNPDL